MQATNRERNKSIRKTAFRRSKKGNEKRRKAKKKRKKPKEGVKDILSGNHCLAALGGDKTASLFNKFLQKILALTTRKC